MRIAEHARQRQLEAALIGEARAHEEAEVRVIERTAELTRANAELKQNVTERKQAEQALRESEEQYRLLFETNPLPMWVYDRETLRFLAVNTAAVEHYGYTREEFLAMTIMDIRPQEEVANLADYMSKGTTLYNHAGGWRHRKKNGTVIDVEITSHQLAFTGRIAKLVLVNDITDRKLAEENLIRSEQRLALAQEAGNIGTFDWDIPTNKVTWTEKLESLFGLRAGGFGGAFENWRERVHPEDEPGE
jgi:PAS domain S-box-containing protein